MKKNIAGWIDIKTPDDAKDLFGEVVAFTTNNPLLGNDEENWQQPGQSGVYFGYIRKYTIVDQEVSEARAVPEMVTVLKPETTGDGRIVLKNEHLGTVGSNQSNTYSLTMRKVTREEVTAIINAVDANTASINYVPIEFGGALTEALAEAFAQNAKRPWYQAVAKKFLNAFSK